MLYFTVSTVYYREFDVRRKFVFISSEDCLGRG